MHILFHWQDSRRWDDRSWESGCGGSQAMMIGYARAFAEAGWAVTCVTNCEEGIHHGVLWTPRVNYDADVFVAVRDPRPLQHARGKKVFLANDQTLPTMPDDLDLLVTISQHQTARFQRLYRVPHSKYLTSSAGVDYRTLSALPHVSTRRCVYTSTPERGLDHLARLWPFIVERVPDAELYVTSGFELYGWDAESCRKHSQHIYDALVHPSIHRVGPLSRTDYLDLLCTAAVLTYPSTYEEMCCISALEASACGVPIVTSAIGALKERVGDNGYLIPGLPGNPAYDAAFVSHTCNLLTNTDIRATMAAAGRAAAMWHDYAILVGQWMSRL